MRRRRSTRKLHVYNRKSRKSKKTSRHVKRRNKQSIKRRNYRGGMSGEKVYLPLNKQIRITDNMESQGLFYLGDFSKQDERDGKVVSKPFYIKFPKMTNEGEIPCYSTMYEHDPKWFEVELYWSSYNWTSYNVLNTLQNFFVKKNRVNSLDRKVHLLLIGSFLTNNNIEDLEFLSKYSIDYDNEKMLESIKIFIQKKINDNRWRFSKLDNWI